MNRHDAIATINAKLADADDETVESVAEFVQALSGRRMRPLSEREKALLEQSREDFKAGRTLSMEEFMAQTDAMFARHRAAKRPP